ncbi:SHOCT domain-containing protein [Oceanicola sp. D3]|uniref:SHOCT domain-containing protein n=1 Tax=Oceanicola sp. D3 TaxID=2587163 RepID=UPI001121F9EE|nr:SHOCT domain-containing protein [Oceanicola sp. D3]QDC08920.1 SHOCT domain-containing protein [Oceanicola sp. D3]
MSALTEDGKKATAEIAARHGVSPGAAEALLFALVQGQGTQAQFNHPELGGMGQWSQGGMTMVGDMFNNALKAQVDGLCADLSALLQQSGTFQRPAASQSQSQSHGTSLFVSGGAASSAWPEELGAPSSQGAQNNMRYAVFPATRRLAIELNGKVEVYDTADHQISGVGQQQSGDQSLTFTSQHGLVRLADLKKVASGAAEAEAPEPEAEAPAAQPEAPITPSAPMAEQSAQPTPPTSAAPAPADSDTIIALIEKLAALKANGILTDAEFEAKKAELLARL